MHVCVHSLLVCIYVLCKAMAIAYYAAINRCYVSSGFSSVADVNGCKRTVVQLLRILLRYFSESAFLGDYSTEYYAESTGNVL